MLHVSECESEPIFWGNLPVWAPVFCSYKMVELKSMGFGFDRQVKLFECACFADI